MTRFLSGLSLLLLLCSSAYAETAPESVPDEPTNTVGVIIFAVLFVGFCVGFIWMVYAADKKKKSQPGNAIKQGNAEARPVPGKTT